MIKMKSYRNQFKCRCMNFYNQRTTGVWLMSGEFSYHISLINLTKPEGLHRTVYQLIPTKKEEFFNTDNENEWESCFKKVVYRYNRWIRKKF